MLLFSLPGGAGDDLADGSWPARLPVEVRLHRLETPGAAVAPRLPGDSVYWSAAVEAAAVRISTHLVGLPYALLARGLGARFAVAVARHLVRHDSAPAHLILVDPADPWPADGESDQPPIPTGLTVIAATGATDGRHWTPVVDGPVQVETVADTGADRAAALSHVLARLLVQQGHRGRPVPQSHAVLTPPAASSA